MITRIHTRALWMAIGLILGGGVLAAAGTVSGEDISDAAKDAPATVSDLANGHGKTKATEAKGSRKNDTSETGDDDVDAADSHERKRNHGYYVSAAAHCEDVEDTENGISFEAPEDCDENGEAHGAYVRQVAKSDAGKKDKPADAGSGD